MEYCEYQNDVIINKHLIPLYHNKRKLLPMSRVNEILQVTKSMSNPIHKAKGVFKGFEIDH